MHRPVSAQDGLGNSCAVSALERRRCAHVNVTNPLSMSSTIHPFVGQLVRKYHICSFIFVFYTDVKFVARATPSSKLCFCLQWKRGTFAGCSIRPAVALHDNSSGRGFSTRSVRRYADLQFRWLLLGVIYCEGQAFTDMFLLLTKS